MRNCKLKKAWALILTVCMALFLMQGAVRAEGGIGRADHVAVEPQGFQLPAPPEINSDTAFLIELNSGVVLYSKNSNQRMYPASVTKVITALIAIEELDFEDTITISEAAIADATAVDGMDGRGRFYAGQTMTVKDAIYAFSLNSVNVIGYTLAEKIDGDIETFCKRMNQKARELGAINTDYHNPHGLNNPEHLTSAYDMAMIMWGAIQNETYREIAGTRSYSFRDADGHEIVCDHNYLVFQPDTDYYDSRAVAGKTGWVEEAMFTRSLYATDGKLDIICTTFHADTTDDAYNDVRRLLDYAFDNFSLVRPPSFGENGVLQSDVTEESSGERFRLSLMPGEVKTLTGADLLVPNELAAQPWKTDIVKNGNALEAKASLGGVEMASYPLTAELIKTGMIVPTTATPGSTRSAGESGNSPLISTWHNETAGSTAGSTETEKAPRSSGWQTALLVIVSMVLIVALLAVAVLARQNKVLKRRAGRRQAVKRRQNGA